MICPDFNLGDFWVNQMLIFRPSTWVVRQHILKPISFVSMRPWVHARCSAFQYQRGLEPWRLNFGAGNVWTAYSVKADCLGISATSRAWNFRNFRNCPGWLQVISSFLFCCFFVPFFSTHTPFPFVHSNKKRRWDETCHCLDCPHCPKSTVTFAKVVWVHN